jgi:predicted ATPase/DNA-binding CsgD family transcriptional regulator
VTPPHRTERFSALELGGRTDGLPLQLTSFVGRERELEEIGACLDETRLLTLTGPGGSGKTRLALAATARLSEGFEDGVRWVWLAPISDPALVAEAVADAVGVRETPGLAPTEAIVERVGDSELLLALDNGEHVVEACAVLADTLLRFCPGLKILSTSREILDVAGETAWAVPPLSLPVPGEESDFESIGRYEAVRLFVERAEVAAPGFALTRENAAAVARVCERLDGIPLAIELAAARVKVLSVGQISERLDDALGLLTGGSRTAPSRHKTLRGALDWSHGLLPEGEKVLFRRMSVLVGEFTLDTAERVCAGEGLEASEVLTLLSRLVDKSLVMVVGREEEARYRLLTTVRQYAQEKLNRSREEREVRRRHALYFLGLAEGAEDALKGPGQEEWLDRLEGELGNLRAALAWSLECADAEDAEAGIRLSGALWRLCYLRGHYGQGRAWLEAALSCEAPSAREPRARALTGAGVLALLQCEYGRAEEHLEEGMALYRELGDVHGEAAALQVLGSVARERGLYDKAEAYHGESLRLWRGLGDEYEAARSLNYLGFVAWLQEDHDRAAELCGQTLADFRRFGDAEGISWALISLGSATLYTGDPARAEPLLEESLATSRRAGYREGVAWSLNQLGVAAHRRGDQEKAEELLRESLKVHRELGDKWRIASVLEGLASTARARGLPERSAQLFGAADLLRATLLAPTPPVERADRDAGLSAARAALGEERFEKALAAGRAIPPEEAIALAATETASPRQATSMPHDLTAREVEVLKLVAEGLTDAQVAEKLYLSPRTIGHHLRSIYRKLRVPSRAAAATAALERGLI